MAYFCTFKSVESSTGPEISTEMDFSKHFEHFHNLSFVHIFISRRSKNSSSYLQSPGQNVRFWPAFWGLRHESKRQVTVFQKSIFRISRHGFSLLRTLKGSLGGNGPFSPKHCHFRIIFQKSKFMGICRIIELSRNFYMLARGSRNFGVSCNSPKKYPKFFKKLYVQNVRYIGKFCNFGAQYCIILHITQTW